MKKSLAYVGFKDKNKLEVVTGLEKDLQDIFNPKGFFSRNIIKPERDAYENVSIFYYNCEQHDLWLGFTSRDSAIFGDFNGGWHNSIIFRNLGDESNSFFDELRNHKYFDKEEVIKSSK